MSWTDRFGNRRGDDEEWDEGRPTPVPEFKGATALDRFVARREHYRRVNQAAKERIRRQEEE